MVLRLLYRTPPSYGTAKMTTSAAWNTYWWVALATDEHNLGQGVKKEERWEG